MKEKRRTSYGPGPIFASNRAQAVMKFGAKVQDNQAASLTERDNRLAQYFALFWVWATFRYFATSDANSDVIFLRRPDFL